MLRHKLLTCLLISSCALAQAGQLPKPTGSYKLLDILVTGSHRFQQAELIAATRLKSGEMVSEDTLRYIPQPDSNTVDVVLLFEPM